MSPRSEEYLSSAQMRLEGARLALAADPAGAVSAAYYAVFGAARAALSERHLHARTHRGAWHLFHEQFVAPGDFDSTLHQAAIQMQAARESADYEAGVVSPGEAAEQLETATRFVQAVRRMLND